MKQILLLLSLLLICNVTIAQKKKNIVDDIKVSIISPKKDTLYLIKSELGTLILKLWISDSSYTRFYVLDNGSKYDAWLNKEHNQKPFVIVMIDERTFDIKKPE